MLLRLAPTGRSLFSIVGALCFAAIAVTAAVPVMPIA